jgi:valyl-tRNA synthetase
MATAKATRQAAPAPLAYRDTHTTAWDTDGMPALVVTEVESTSIPGLWYTVRYHVAEETAQCQCTAASYGRRCGHAAVASREGRAVVAQYRAAVARELADHWHDEFTRDALLRGL